MTKNITLRMDEEILKKDSQSLIAANNLAFFLAEYKPTEENLKRAQNLLVPLATNNKRSLVIQDTVAWIYYRKGDFKIAAQQLEGFEEKIKSYPLLSYHLGMIYMAQGENARAREYLDIAVNTNEEFSGKIEAKKALLDLKG